MPTKLTTIYAVSLNEPSYALILVGRVSVGNDYQCCMHECPATNYQQYDYPFLTEVVLQKYSSEAHIYISHLLCDFANQDNHYGLYLRGLHELCVTMNQLVNVIH